MCGVVDKQLVYPVGPGFTSLYNQSEFFISMSQELFSGHTLAPLVCTHDGKHKYL
jgi:hypothetical protein